MTRSALQHLVRSCYCWAGDDWVERGTKTPTWRRVRRCAPGMTYAGLPVK